MFQRRSTAPNSAFSAAMRMSASSAFSSPAAKRVSVHRGDHRLEHVDAAGVPALAGVREQAATVGVPIAGIGRSRGVGQVPAGAEGGVARAGDHEHERRVVVAEALPRVVQLPVHRPVDGVVLLRPVVGQRDHVAVLRVVERVVAHARKLDAAPVGYAGPGGKLWAVDVRLVESDAPTAEDHYAVDFERAAPVHRTEQPGALEALQRAAVSSSPTTATDPAVRSSPGRIGWGRPST